MTRAQRLRFALILNVVIVAVQIVAGIVASSVGLLADAGHNLTDVAAVLLALIAVSWAARPPTDTKSCGYHRATVLAALANAGSILAITLVIVDEAINRLLHPESVDGTIVVVVALIAFAANTVSALVLRERGNDLNMRAALLHMIGDAAASLGVAFAGLVILLTGGYNWLDPVVSLGIALLISIQAWKLVNLSLDVLLESTPADIDPSAVMTAMVATEGVDDAHDLHIWSLSSEVRALSAHLVMSGHPTLEEAQAIGDRVKECVEHSFRIAHSTLELECEPCDTEDACLDANLAKYDSHTGHAH